MKFKWKELKHLNLSIDCMSRARFRVNPHYNIKSNAPAGKYLQHSLIIYPVWLNGWVFVYEQIGFGFESRCGHLNIESGTVIYQQYSPEGKHEIAYAIPSTKSGTETNSSRLVIRSRFKKINTKIWDKNFTISFFSPSHFSFKQLPSRPQHVLHF